MKNPLKFLLCLPALFLVLLLPMDTAWADFRGFTPAIVVPNGGVDPSDSEGAFSQPPDPAQAEPESKADAPAEAPAQEDDEPQMDDSGEADSEPDADDGSASEPDSEPDSDGPDEEG